MEEKMIRKDKKRYFLKKKDKKLFPDKKTVKIKSLYKAKL